MKVPTLEEVKEHFKGANIIKWNGSKREYLIDIDRYGIYQDASGNFRQSDNEYLYAPLLWTSHEGYAEIVEYKDDIVSNINKGIKIIKDMEQQPQPQQNETEFQLSFETVGGVDVILTGNNLHNLNVIANQIR